MEKILYFFFFFSQITPKLLVLEDWQQTGVFPENLAWFIDKGEDMRKMLQVFKYFHNCPIREKTHFEGLEQGRFYRKFWEEEFSPFISKGSILWMQGIQNMLTILQ